ncbi:MAG TPA: fused MFS/spermidine synthase [Solirubrobacteraceae bacterium]|nr:fused MFS/spermidine synthase [Solirubrobacteraceae bacterium]
MSSSEHGAGPQALDTIEAPDAIQSTRALGVLVFVVGAASLGTEIAAARLLAPYFGASTIIWANTIAIVLVALSAGYAIGGRIADRSPRISRLCQIVVAAALLLAAIPFVSAPLLRLAAGALGSLSVGGFFGSLAAVLALVAVPIVLLGMVAPFAIRLSIAGPEDSGKVSGHLYAVSTCGSLAGTFLAALVLIPFAGTHRTFLAFALALAIAAAPGLPRRWTFAPLILLVLLVLPPGAVNANVTGDGKVIYETETPYQYARVVERPDGERLLQLNEGVAAHSLYVPHSYLTNNYWDQFQVLPFAGLSSPPSRIAILGDAAGTTARAYSHYFPRTTIDAVELDAQLTAIGHRFFALPTLPTLHFITADARPWLASTPRRYDAIFLDAYRQPYIPFYLTTHEFFARVRDHLTARGVLAINVGHPEGSSALERALSATLATVFPHVLRDPSQPTNTLVIASAAPISSRALRSSAAWLPADLRGLAEASASRLAPALRGGPVYTDDRAPVEWLVDTSLLGYATGTR